MEAPGGIGVGGRGVARQLCLGAKLICWLPPTGPTARRQIQKRNEDIHYSAAENPVAGQL